MIDRPHFPLAAGPEDLTLDAPSADTNVSGDRRFELAPTDPPCRVHLVEGSGHCLSSETETLLRTRLRLASLALLIGFAAFLVWQLLYIDILARWDYTAIFASHVGVMLALGFAAASMCRRCVICASKLRLYELLIFGLPAIYLAGVEGLRMNAVAWEVHALLNHLATEGAESLLASPFGFVWFPLAPWLLLIFIYAQFIPNTWQRAAIVLGSFALLPAVVIAAMVALHPVGWGVFAHDATWLAQDVLSIVVAAVLGVLGVKTIGALRAEAYEARQLGQYRLRHKLGAGGMGEVFLAEHQLLKRPCAIKLIRPEKAGDPQVLARFEREVQATAKLSHWNSIEIFDYGRTADGVFYYVMEYLPGLNLQEIVERFGPLPPERVVHLLRQACRALREAHEMGLLHRDIKPANIFAAQRGGVFDVAKLLDFGLVKPTAQRGSVQLTQDGVITGSPLYMSPEQASGEEVDARSDIYAVGCVAYFLLTGRPPFPGEKPMKVLLAHAKDAPTQPSALYGGVPADLEQVVLRCLAKSPEERYRSAEELEAALAATESADRWSAADAAAWWSDREAKTAETPELALA